MAEQPLIDAHHHLWQLPGDIRYPWLTEGERYNDFLGDYRSICQSFMPEQLRALVPSGYALQASVHCEAECDREQAEDEARWIAGLGRQSASVAQRQVVWVDLLADDVDEKLARMKAVPGVCGVRFKPVTAALSEKAVQPDQPNHTEVAGHGRQMAQPHQTNLADHGSQPGRPHHESRKGHQLPGSLQDERLRRGLVALERHGLMWDLRVPGAHLKEAATLVSDVPGLRVMLNHCGLPWDRSAAGLNQWREGLDALAAQPDVWVKLSELGCPHRAYDETENQVLLDEVLGILGGERACFASNAPVAGLRVSYARWLGMVEAAIARVSPKHRQDVLWQNAVRCYGLA